MTKRPDVDHEHVSRPEILLVDDSLTNRTLGQAALRALGYRVDSVANGAQALGALQTRHYDLVLMDIEMPGIDGLETTRRIRSRDSQVLCRDIPIVAMTGHDSTEFVRQCRQAGMDDYTAKPICAAAIQAVVKRYLQTDRATKPRWAAGDGSDTPCAAAGEAADQTAQPFDRTALLQRLGGDEEILHRLVTAYAADLSSRLGTLKAALGAGDHEAVRSLAHTLKGTSSNIGAPAMTELAARIEKAAKGADLQAAQFLKAGLDREVERLRRAFAREGVDLADAA